MSQRSERLREQRLQIHLPRVDHVVDAGGSAECGYAVRLARIGRRCPQLPTTGLHFELPVMEVAPEQAEFPELVGDVLSDIRDDAVRPDDHLLARFLVLVVFARAISIRTVLD